MTGHCPSPERERQVRHPSLTLRARTMLFLRQFLTQLGKRLAPLCDDGHGSALRIGPLRLERYAQVAEDGGGQIGGRDLAAFDGATATVCAADNLAMTTAAAGRQHGHNREPMFPTAILGQHGS